MIAALFVETNGVYFGLKNVDPWDINRDARNYKGPYPVIAHPPCERWGRYWSGGPSAKTRKLKGDDSGCFYHSIWSVRTFGGLIEHPADSHAFKWFGLKKPIRGVWLIADDFGGHVTCVDQGVYGHRAKKATWLYAVLSGYPSLNWSIAKNKTRIDPGFHSKQEAMSARGDKNYTPIKRLTKKERIETPVEFRDELIRLVSEY